MLLYPPTLVAEILHITPIKQNQKRRGIVLTFTFTDFL